MSEPVREGVTDGIRWRIVASDVFFAWQGYAHIPDGHVWRPPVKSRVRTIMLDRRVYRVAMQAKGGR